MNNVFFITALDGAWIPVWAVVIAAVAAYFIGNINPAILFGKAKGIDIRAQGSGNAGATNAVRSLGKKVGAITFLIDVAKGWICCFIPTLIFQQITPEGRCAKRSSLIGDAGRRSSCRA